MSTKNGRDTFNFCPNCRAPQLGREVSSILPDAGGGAEHRPAAVLSVFLDELVNGSADQFALLHAAVASDCSKFASLPTGEIDLRSNHAIDL